MNYDIIQIQEKFNEKLNIDFADVLIDLIDEAEGQITNDIEKEIRKDLQWYSDKHHELTEELRNMSAAIVTNILNEEHFHGLSEFSEECSECQSDVRESELDIRDYYLERQK